MNQLHAYRMRVSIFVDPDPVMVEYALRTGADRVELYTGPYAEMFETDPKKAIERYRPAAEKAHELGLGMNAGHDFNLKNLKPFIKAFPWTAEVSIGHAIICDALYLGIQETIQEYSLLTYKPVLSTIEDISSPSLAIFIPSSSNVNPVLVLILVIPLLISSFMTFI